MEKSKINIFCKKIINKPRYSAIHSTDKKIVMILAAVFFILALCCSAILCSYWQQYKVSSDCYSVIRAELFTKKRDNINNKTITEKQLKSIGKDIVGWIKFPDTNIDYPVAQCDNNSYYCYHLSNNNYNVCGTIFMDCTKDSKLNSHNTVLYGHHMKNGSMFQNITLYKNSDYYALHKTAMYYTPNGNYEIQIAYGFIISSSVWEKENYIKDENIAQLLDFAKKNTTFDSEVEIYEDDSIMTFSTCSYEFGNANYMLIGKVVPKNE